MAPGDPRKFTDKESREASEKQVAMPEYSDLPEVVMPPQSNSSSSGYHHRPGSDMSGYFAPRPAAVDRLNSHTSSGPATDGLTPYSPISPSLPAMFPQPPRGGVPGQPVGPVGGWPLTSRIPMSPSVMSSVPGSPVHGNTYPSPVSPSAASAAAPWSPASYAAPSPSNMGSSQKPPMGPPPPYSEGEGSGPSNLHSHENPFQNPENPFHSNNASAEPSPRPSYSGPSHPVTIQTAPTFEIPIQVNGRPSTAGPYHGGGGGGGGDSGEVKPGHLGPVAAARQRRRKLCCICAMLCLVFVAIIVGIVVAIAVGAIKVHYSSGSSPSTSTGSNTNPGSTSGTGSTGSGSGSGTGGDGFGR